MIEYFDENDLLDLFGQSVLTGVDQTERELGRYYCTKVDQYNFKIVISMIMAEDWFILTMYEPRFCEKPFFSLNLEQCVNLVTRDKSILKFYNDNSKCMATLSLEPNFSLNLPELSITKEPTPQMLECPMVFCQRTLALLFECEPVVDEAGNISFSKTNSEGFTLFVTVLPSARKCFAKLTFVHYQDPVFQVTFTEIVAIDCDLTAEGKGLIIKGQQESEVVKILFNPTFSMELETWIFY